MKKFLIPFICIFALYSCSFSKDIEKTENNSGTTLSGNISENISQTGSENSEKQEEKSEKISNCKRIYDFAIGYNYEVEKYRQFEFHFLGDCSEQKKSIQINDFFNDGFKVEGGYKALFTNYLMKLDSISGPGGCFIKTEKKSKKFKNNNFEISIKGGDEVCYDGYSYDEISEGKKQIFIEIKENNKQLIDIMLIKISSQDFEKNYNDLVWTMEKGFFETGKNFSQKDIDDIKYNQKIEKKNSINWTKENLAKAQFIEHDYGYDINWFIENNDFDVKVNIEPIDINPYGGCNAGRRKSECLVEKIDDNFVYWKNIYSAKDSFDGDNIDLYTDGEVRIKTSIKNGKTEILDRKIDEYCYDKIKNQKVSCEY